MITKKENKDNNVINSIYKVFQNSLQKQLTFEKNMIPLQWNLNP